MTAPPMTPVHRTELLPEDKPVAFRFRYSEAASWYYEDEAPHGPGIGTPHEIQPLYTRPTLPSSPEVAERPAHTIEGRVDPVQWLRLFAHDPETHNFDGDDAKAVVEAIDSVRKILHINLNVTDEELVRIRNSTQLARNGEVKIWDRMLGELVDAIRSARKALP